MRQLTRTRSLRSAAGLGLTIVALATGCALTVETSPDAYDFPSAQVFAVAPGVSVSVSNAYAAEERVELGSRVFCDLRQFTETATAMVQRELASKGAAVAPGGRKTVLLRVTHPDWVQGMWTMKGRVRLEVELGSGQKLSYDGESQTGGNAMRAFNGAILRAVTAFLGDPAAAAYLNATAAAQR